MVPPTSSEKEEGTEEEETSLDSQQPYETTDQSPTRTPRLASIEEPTIKAYVTEIKNEQGTATKVIQNTKYRLGMIDTLLLQISSALASKNKPTGPVVTSLVNKTL